MASNASKLGVGVALLAAVLGLGVFAVIRFLFFGLDEATPWDKPASVGETTVELTYLGRECRDRVQVMVEEDPATVLVTITESVRSVVCGEDETASYDVSVELQEPLGQRTLVDGACQLGRFEQDPRCAEDLVTAVRGGDEP